MSRGFFTGLVCVWIVAATASISRGALIAEDSFTYTDGPLAGKNGGTGAWTSAWSGPLNVLTGASFSSGFMNVAGNQVVSQPDGLGNEVSAYYRRSWSTTGVSELYFRLDYTVPTLGSGEVVTNVGGIYGGITVGALGRPFFNNNASIYTQLFNTQPNHLRGDLRPGGSFSTPDMNDALFTFDTLHTLVGRIDSPTASSTRLTIWFDPTSSGDSPIFSSTQNFAWTAYNTGFVSLYRESQNVTAPIYDTVRLGTTFDDVLPPIPEPGTASTLGVIGIAAFLSRRRAKSENRV
jgi:hypothetical protein